jgi:predicted ATPase
MASTPSIRTPDQRLRVFISGDREEAARERDEVRKAIAALHLTPVFADLPGLPHAPREVYRSYVEQSEIFIAIYRAGYGWIPPGELVSSLEDEFELAKGLPRLVYVKDEPQRDQRLTDLIERAATSGVLVRSYSSVRQLRTLVQDDLALVMTERFVASGETIEQPGAPGLAALPDQPTRFVGRAREVAEVEKLVLDDGVRLITLSGPGGIGKSRLAFQVAARVAHHFEDGLAHVLLGSISDPQLVTAAIARTLDVKESSERTVLENVKEFLRDRELLMVVDNFEHLIDAAPVLSQLVSAAPRLKLMITSRAVLFLRGENEYQVPPLSTTGGDAVELFVERAQAANPHFELTDDNKDAIAEICERLDGLPLGIELAAARIRLLTPQAMLQRLSSRLQLLTGGPADLPERQRTLRATLDWDYDMLSEEERTVFRRLAVFAAGFSFEAADHVTNAGASDLDVLDVVESLVAKSLLQQRWSGSAPRFSMLRTLREYAFEKLNESDETDEVRTHHADFFIALVEDAAPKLASPDQVESLHLLDAEHDNLRAALRWQSTQPDAARMLEFTAALTPYWEFRAYLTEGQKWLEDALAGAADAPSDLRALCLEGAGVLARGQGEYKRAAALIEEALVLRREAGDTGGLANALKQLGIVAAERGDYAAARDLYQQSLDKRREIGDERGIAEAENNLGVLARLHGDLDAATKSFEGALDFFHNQGDRRAEGRVLMNLGEVNLEHGRFDLAGERLRQSLVLCKEVESHWDITDLLELLASVASGKREARKASVLFGAGEALRDLLGTPLPASEKEIYDRRVAAARDQLDEEEFKAAWDEGRNLAEDEAVELALSV